MRSTPYDVSDDVLDRAARVRPEGPARDDLRALLGLYYRHVPSEDVAGREPVALAAAAQEHRDLARSRPAGTALVRALPPSEASTTVVQVVTDDMPFLVDSVTAELTRQGREIRLVVHPTLRVERDDAGGLVAVTDAHGAGPGAVESWIRVEVDPVSGVDDLAAVVAELQRVLADVRAAVDDWQAMRDGALALAAELEARPAGHITTGENAESAALLRWLADDHFTFLGYREYDLVTADEPAGTLAMRALPASGLGILRAGTDRPAARRELPAEVGRRALEPLALVVTKANARSTVHRPVHLDYIGVKRFDAEGAVTGERRLLGLFTSTAYTETVQRIPVLRRRAAEVLERSGYAATSYSGKDLLQVVETYPRDELFQVGSADLLPVVRAVAQLQERRRLRLFVRRDDYGRFTSCIVYFPRDRYTTEVRLRMQAILRTAFRATSVDYATRVTESVLARLHFVVRAEPGRQVTDVDTAEVETRLAGATRSWSDDLSEALVPQVGAEEASRLLRDFPDAFPEAYKEDFPAAAAVVDLVRLDRLAAGLPVSGGLSEPGAGLLLDLYDPYPGAPGQRRFKIYRDGPLSLSTVLPVLQRMGLEVLDERPYEVTRGDGKLLYLYDFGLRYAFAARPDQPDAATTKRLFEEAFAAIWSGAAESDGFNALVLRAGLEWRQAVVLRAYAAYLRQAGTPFSQGYIEQCLTANTPVVRLLVRLFEARGNPAYEGQLGEVEDALVEEVDHALEAVESLDQDRILRALLDLVRATLRTNYFQHAPGGGQRPYLAFKLDPSKVGGLPRPVPRYEVWVYSPRVEGVHLRFGAVARGGLRWSDRREDFRTEVLGLVKAQMVKNAVIVPVGAKGGFVGKQLPDPAVSREAWLAEGIACYQDFVRGLLDLTDNLVGGVVVPPADVVRHDGDDPYLVVAADKGTATFSDIANGISADHGFWLGDAFASGGSVGYDHKVMGITARGAWESVQRHFRELGTDVQSEPVTVVGIGDMSGDVFGNGMLLSRELRLVAAFDHRHVFLDPDPDPEVSWRERARLFALPRSSWADYSASEISAGGGVHLRAAKSVPVSPQVRALLDLAPGTTALTPAQLITAILRAPVDLLWNGGIGTYVKAAAETSAAVGDKANDAIRVDGAALRARVVGEGGNLGLTQLGRIEAAAAGVRLNTDAIDNSAGVDCSDHEVNIKVLVDAAVHDGALDPARRSELLAAMTDEVAALVLRDNYEQNVLLGVARSQAAAMAPVHVRLMDDLERRGHLDRAIEFLPTGAALASRSATGHGLTSPELAVLAAYAKITLTEELLASDLPDAPWFRTTLRAYFPAELVARFDARLDAHPLRREIVTTCVVNDMVNRGGITFAFRAGEETGARPAAVARAYTAVRDIFDLPSYWSEVEALDATLPAAQGALYLEGRRLLDRSVRWLLQHRTSTINVAAELARFAADVRALAPLVPELMQGAEAAQLQAEASVFQARGVPEPLALRAAALLHGFGLLDVVEVARATGRPAREVAEVSYALSEHIGVDGLLTRITGLPRGDRWEALARSALRYDLYAALAALTSDVLTSTPPGPAAARIAAWEHANAEGLLRSRSTLAEIAARDGSDLAALSVALRTIRTLVGT